jgi:hypothetical protein
MIAELFFIVDLLTKRQLMDPSTPTIGPPEPAKPKTVPPPRGLGLFELGKIETITQPLIMDPTKFDYLRLDWKPDYKKGRF